jgi:hypothetical protein
MSIEMNVQHRRVALLALSGAKMDIPQKTAIMTGGSQGIGAALVIGQVNATVEFTSEHKADPVCARRA